jgi:anaerobic ribonucleoside-triphosphate reductase activating protein
MCDKCHNPESWAFEGGAEYTVKQITKLIARQKRVSGVTFSGGEPFSQAGELAEVALFARARGLNVVTYTGFTFEKLVYNKAAAPLLALTDILVDGRYVHALRDIGLKFRGSSNQRLIDVKASLMRGRVVLWEGTEIWQPTEDLLGLI